MSNSRKRRKSPSRSSPKLRQSAPRRGKKKRRADTSGWEAVADRGEGENKGAKETVADGRGERGLTMAQILVPAAECPRAHTAHN